jgi:hypothetical protein
MKQYSRYLIRSTDLFDPENYSAVDEEVRAINKETETLPSLFKVEIILSYLKDHSIQNDWIIANPSLTNLVTSGSLFKGSIESLFESCRNHPAFRKDFEKYLVEQFSQGIPVASR